MKIEKIVYKHTYVPNICDDVRVCVKINVRRGVGNRASLADQGPDRAGRKTLKTTRPAEERWRNDTRNSAKTFGFQRIPPTTASCRVLTRTATTGTRYRGASEINYFRRNFGFNFES